MNNKFVNIILISSDWKNNHRKGLHLALNDKLSEWSEVIFVEYPYSVFIHTVIKFKSRFLNLLKNFNLRNYGLIKVYTPFILFHDKIWKKNKPSLVVDSALLGIQMSNFIKNNYPDRIKILWVDFPYNYYLTKKVKPDFLIYDYYDNYSYNIDGTLNKFSDELNENIIKDSQLIFCTALSMYKNSIKFSENAHLIPNGHNFDLEKISKVEKAILPVKGEIIGYLGNIRDWIDFSLILNLLSKLKANQYLVFVGPVEKNVLGIINKFKNNPKFLHIEKVPYEETWKYIKCFDIGIIPFKINKFTEGVLPYKFYEYTACGIKIVSTALPDIKQFSEIIFIGTNEEEFTEYCVNWNKHTKNDFEKKYLTIAENSTWDKRADEINMLIKEKLKV